MNDYSLCERINASADRVRAQKDHQARIETRKQEEFNNIKKGLICTTCFVGVCFITCVLMAMISHYTGIIFE